MVPDSRRVALLRQAALSSKVARLHKVEAWKVAGEKLLLLLLLRLELSQLELWVMAPNLLLLWSTQLTPRWGIHHAVR
jgi:hypothetical protein